MSISNYDICHGFFYNDNGGRYYPSYKSLGYDGDCFYSYWTLIGKLATANNGRRVLLASIDSMSTTTAKHLSYLKSACPFDIIPVYMKYGEHYGELKDFVTRALDNMKYYAGANLRQRANRDGFLMAFNSFNELAANFKIGVKMPRQYTELAKIINDSPAVKAYQARAVEREKRAEQRRRAAVKKMLQTRSLTELARLAYDYNAPTTPEQRAEIRAAINPAGAGLSFVWTDAAGNFQTSQHIYMDAKEGLTALKLWAAGKLKHGLTVGRYTVLEVLPDVVKIGCHKIPVENIRELATAAGLVNA